MINDPKIPMLPTERPQQRIHEVVGLPERPEPFDCFVCYEVGENDIFPKQVSRSAIYLCLVEWAWAPAHDRMDAYYLHRGRGYWILWIRYWDESENKWEWNAVGFVPRKSVTERQAAVYLLLEFWKFDAKESNVDQFHWINEGAYLSVAELAAIAREVWGDG